MEPSADRTADEVWEAVLDDLETQLNRAERFLERLDAETIESWATLPPAVPMPRYLVPRAQALLERQQTIISAIPQVMAKVRSRAEVSARFSGARDAVPSARRESSVYVDVNA